MDLRKYTSQTTFRLILGAGLLLLVVGLGLIAYLYGPLAALMGFLCLLGMLVPVGLIVFFLFGLDKLVKKMNDE